MRWCPRPRWTWRAQTATQCTARGRRRWPAGVSSSCTFLSGADLSRASDKHRKRLCAKRFQRDMRRCAPILLFLALACEVFPTRENAPGTYVSTGEPKVVLDLAASDILVVKIGNQELIGRPAALRRWPRSLVIWLNN